MNRNISVIIPVLNEELVIEETLSVLTGQEGIEVIVADGGSSDDTVTKALTLTDRVIKAPRGRASQMNAGARQAGGDILFFLHADCLPPNDFRSLINMSLEKQGIVAGAFDIRIAHEGKPYRLIEKMANLRSRMTRIPYGDQGLFMFRSTFESMEGFRDIPLMEDIEMGGRLKRMGHVDFIQDTMHVSPRRWLKEGIVRTTLKDWALALSYGVLKVPPEKLAGYYGNAR